MWKKWLFKIYHSKFREIERSPKKMWQIIKIVVGDFQDSKSCVITDRKNNLLVDPK